MTMSGLSWVLFTAFLVALVTGAVAGVAALVGHRGPIALTVAGALVVIGLVGSMIVPMMAADGASSMMGGGMGSMMGSSSGGGASRCQSAPATTSSAVSASIAGFTFCPSTLVLRAGEPVTWTNADSAAHTVTSQAAGTFDSGAIAKGRSWTLPSLQPGTYAYYCRIHAWMRGQLRVEA